jgi:hypothetical protein
MAITEEFFRDNGYRITKTKFYKKFEEFTVEVVVHSLEPSIEFLETGNRLTATPSISFQIMFSAEFCRNLGIFWSNNPKHKEVPREIFSLYTTRCPIQNTDWKISGIADFDRYRVGIRMRCLEYIEKTESLRDPRLHFRYKFGSKESKPQNIGGYEDRTVALYRIGHAFGIDDEDFVWGIEKWRDKTREDYKELLYRVNTPRKPLPHGLTVTYAKNYDPFKDHTMRVTYGNKYLRGLAKALGLDPETWTIRNPVTGNID